MNTRVPQEYIHNLQGKNFVLFTGLLELAHQDGMNYSSTEIIQIPNDSNGNTAIVKAVVRTSKGEFSGIGDASPKSVTAKIVPHLLRMAETRAMGRALRFATNVNMTAFEELGADLDVPEPAQTTTPTPAPRQQAPAQAPTAPMASEALKNEVMQAAQAAGLDGKGLQPILKNRGMSWNRLTQPQAESLLSQLKSRAEELKKNLALSAEYEASRGGAV